MIKNLTSEIINKINPIIDQNLEKVIEPGKDYIPVTRKLIDREDLHYGIDSVLDGWLTTGRFADKFEEEIANYIGSRKALIVNSGSSANLNAFYALTSSSLKEKALKPGDEIITVAAGFPTTINPLIQFGCVPVFIDISIPTYNIDASKIESAINDNTKAIVLAHSLGNPFDLNVVIDICKKYNLWLIEDDCDSLGAEYNSRKTGSFGDLATLSFYPAHHITMGEGGAVLINNRRLLMPALSFRDWGRDCYCKTGCDNTCNKRYDWQLGDLPHGYDHKYIYSHIGFNLKVTDMQASIGLSQLSKVDHFVSKRRENHQYLYDLFKKDLESYFILPEKTKNSNPSWFGFMLTLRDEKKIQRDKLLIYLEENKIGTRLFFGGNMTKQPAYKFIDKKIHDNLSNSDYVMNNSFWIGVWPGLEKQHLEYMYLTIKKFVLNNA